MGIFKLNGVDYMGGGGGNTNYEELTQLEYDALTEEEKNNGTIYFITDANSNQDSKFQPVIYSESEREIGVWADGKPLYQKTYTVTVAANAEATLDTDIDFCFWVGNNYITSTEVLSAQYIGSGVTAYCYVAATYRNNVWTMILQNMRNAQMTYCVTVRYTKATDQPGSGQWTPQGVPAHHYSTEEQIVGTWVDGSTVYEKVWNFSSPPVLSTQWLNVGIDCSTFDKILHVHTIHSDGTGYGDVCADPANNDHMLRLKAYSSSTCATLILRYTKKSS